MSIRSTFLLRSELQPQTYSIDFEDFFSRSSKGKYLHRKHDDLRDYFDSIDPHDFMWIEVEVYGYVNDDMYVKQEFFNDGESGTTYLHRPNGFESQQSKITLSASTSTIIERIRHQEDEEWTVTTYLVARRNIMEETAAGYQRISA